MQKLERVLLLCTPHKLKESPSPFLHKHTHNQSHWLGRLIVYHNLIGRMPAGHCAAASDGEQEKDEGPLLTKEVKGTTDRKQARGGGVWLEKEKEILRKRMKETGKKQRRVRY